MDEATRKKLEELYTDAVGQLEAMLEARGMGGLTVGEVTFKATSLLKLRVSRCPPGQREVTRCEPLPDGGVKCRIVCERE
jgi:hypothetical protein